MGRSTYYEELKALAREKRASYGVCTEAFGLREVRVIYKREGIIIDQRPFPYKLKAVYMCDGGLFSVGVRCKLPDEPKLFALVHELKHHYKDRDALGSGVLPCCDYNQNKEIEIGAEVFAAEFIYPEAEFAENVRRLGIPNWTANDVVDLKRSTIAKVSYTFLCKRLEWLELVRPDGFKGVQFKKLEESVYGTPFRRRRTAIRIGGKSLQYH